MSGYPVDWDLPGLQIPNVPDPQSNIDNAGGGLINGLSDVITSGLDGYFDTQQAKWNARNPLRYANGPNADQAAVYGVQNPPGSNAAWLRRMGGGDNTMLWIAGGLLGVGALALFMRDN